jgi:CheY-like chemotaxis protein
MPKNLLVADDSLTIRKVIGMIFATEDFQVTAVDNGLDAISRTRELRPDVVLADVMMPGKSGYEVCEALKSDPATQGIPVVLLAGTFEAFDENRARAARADDHIAKPFESQILLDKVKALVGQKSNTMPSSMATRVTPPSAQPPAAAPAPQAAAPAAARPPAGIPQGPQSGLPRPPGPGMAPPGAPGAPRPPGPGMAAGPGMARPPGPGTAPPGAPRPPGPGMPPGAAARPGVPPPPGAPAPGMPPRPGMPPAPGAPPGMARPGMPQGAQPGFPRPPGPAAPLPPTPGAAPQPAARARDPFGLGAPAASQAPAAQSPISIEDSLPETHGAEEISLDMGTPPAPNVARPATAPAQARPAAADGGEAQLREALSKASREVIEKIAWEVVPQLAETIIREELERLIKDRETQH